MNYSSNKSGLLTGCNWSREVKSQGTNHRQVVNSFKASHKEASSTCIHEEGEYFD